MDKVFILRVGHQTFEPIKKNSRSFKDVDDGSYLTDVAKVSSLHFGFSDYLVEDDAPVGAKLWCDYGSGYGFDNGRGIIELRPGETAHFSYEGTCVDDEGDPEEFSVDYYFELLEWDDELMEK